MTASSPEESGIGFPYRGQSAAPQNQKKKEMNSRFIPIYFVRSAAVGRRQRARDERIPQPDDGNLDGFLAQDVRPIQQDPRLPPSGTVAGNHRFDAAQPAQEHRPAAGRLPRHFDLSSENRFGLCLSACLHNSYVYSLRAYVQLVAVMQRTGGRAFQRKWHRIFRSVHSGWRKSKCVGFHSARPPARMRGGFKLLFSRRRGAKLVSSGIYQDVQYVHRRRSLKPSGRNRTTIEADGGFQSAPSQCLVICCCYWGGKWRRALLSMGNYNSFDDGCQCSLEKRKKEKKRLDPLSTEILALAAFRPPAKKLSIQGYESVRL